jgi:tRNA 2-selenouridine synthase
LQQKDQQIIDLEGLANHKGSALGGVGMPEQPRNEMFENLLAIKLFGLNPERFTYIENESRMIGLCAIPQGLWVQMQQAPSIEILVDRETRISRILAEYAHLPKELLIEQTQKLRKRLGGQHEKAAIEALEQDDFKTWVELLLVYYDKSYAHFVEKNNLSLQKFAWDWNQLETSLLSFIELKTS